jgi:predicted ATPase
MRIGELAFLLVRAARADANCKHGKGDEYMGLRDKELAAFLNTLRALSERQFRAVEKALHIKILSINGFHVEVNNLGEVELRLREGNTLIPARVVSEVTLRILRLLTLAGVTEPPALSWRSCSGSRLVKK